MNYIKCTMQNTYHILNLAGILWDISSSYTHIKNTTTKKHFHLGTKVQNENISVMYRVLYTFSSRKKKKPFSSFYSPTHSNCAVCFVCVKVYIRLTCMFCTIRVCWCFSLSLIWKKWSRKKSMRLTISHAPISTNNSQWKYIKFHMSPRTLHPCSTSVV